MNLPQYASTRNDAAVRASGTFIERKTTLNIKTLSTHIILEQETQRMLAKFTIPTTVHHKDEVAPRPPRKTLWLSGMGPLEPLRADVDTD